MEQDYVNVVAGDGRWRMMVPISYADVTYNSYSNDEAIICMASPEERAKWRGPGPRLEITVTSQQSDLSHRFLRQRFTTNGLFVQICEGPLLTNRGGQCRVYNIQRELRPHLWAYIDTYQVPGDERLNIADAMKVASSIVLTSPSNLPPFILYSPRVVP
jgi:hypothetical protein